MLKKKDSELREIGSYLLTGRGNEVENDTEI